MTPYRMGSDISHRGMHDGPPRGQPVWSSVGAGAHTEGLGSLAEALDRILCKGVAVDGAVTIGVAGVELILLDLRLLLAAIDVVNPEGSFFSASPSSFDPSGRPAPSRTPVAPTGEAAAPWPPTRTSNADPSRGLSRPDLADALADAPSGRKGPQHGLMKLVLTLVNLLHEVLERQAVRRMGNGTLTPTEIEDIGTALYAQAMEIARLREQFGLSETDLTLRLSAAG
jgi:hypothetical protein